ncbi:MAG: peroxiredoxin family protein [Candidatus Thorarchaeota archaeon]
MDSHNSDSDSCLQVGDTAPDFVLPGTEGEDIHLNDLLDNNVVLVFFTDTFTVISTGLAGSFLKLHESLSNLGVTFIGVATEPLSTLETFIEDQDIPFIMASDFDRTVSKAYGVYADEVGSLRCVARPSIIVIDTAGKIDYIWIGHDDESFPKVEAIADRIIKSKLE